MSKISIVLRRGKMNQRGECPVAIKHTHKGSDYLKSLGFSLTEKEWNEKREQVRDSHPLASEHNETISSRRRELEQALRRIADQQQQPTAAALEQAVVEVREIAKNLPTLLEKLDVARGNRLEKMEVELQELLQKVEAKRAQIRRWHRLHGSGRSLLVSKEMDGYILSIGGYAKRAALMAEEGTPVQRLPGTEVLKPATARIYETVHRLLGVWRPGLQIGDCNVAVIDEFKAWLQSRHVKPSSIKSYLLKFTKFARWSAKNYELDHADELKEYRHGVKFRIRRPTFLTPVELEQLCNVQLPTRTLEDVRDMMVLMVFTGLRISDAKLAHRAIINDEIVLTTQKTGTDVTIPLAPAAKQLLKRRNYQLPTFTYSYFSREIKEVAKLAKLERPILKDGKYRPLHEVISAHWGRRTFASFALEAKVNPAVLKEWLGHSRMDQC
ncbi:tyrosine-type recombinase/integrase [Hymenobacter sp. CRA2]|uniref:tyrosine-type recombinase/integrase n=1 Tax=Hymenobacter sp. CRA2 TaxID=1955620 RepID=UPI001117A3A8|nr:tyrosine-type recombinase/integrase [Hymenobacter sp. CRA2]